MAKTIDHILREILGNQTFELARLQAANQALAEEIAKQKDETAKVRAELAATVAMAKAVEAPPA